MTPTVSANQEMIVPQKRPKISPFAVEMKMEGRNQTTLITTSMKKLMKAAYTPKVLR